MITAADGPRTPTPSGGATPPGEESTSTGLRQTIGLFLGPALFILLMLVPVPGVRPEAAHLAAVLAWTMVYWVCEPVPLAITALFAPALCVVLGIGEARVLLASFGDPVVFMFLGSFLLAQAMMAHGLDRRLALIILGIGWVSRSAARVLLVFGALAAFLSMWLSNTATTAMLVPIALGILSVVSRSDADPNAAGAAGRAAQGRRMATTMLLLTAYAASVGGIATPIGTPPNLIGIGLIAKLTGVEISFFEWMKFATPTMVLMYGVLFLLLMRLNPPEFTALPELPAYLRRARAELGPWSRGQVNALVAFLVAIALWVTPGVLALVWGSDAPVTRQYQKTMPEGVASIIAASLLFVLPIKWTPRRFTLDWDEAKKIDWGTILLFGGGIALGGLMFSTGLAEALGRGILHLTGVRGLWGITAMAVVMGILISETTSNTASASMVIPLAISLAQSAGLDPLLPALGACLGASYGFMMPVSTPPNAIVYGTGLVPIGQMIKAGVLFDALGVVLILAGLRLAQWVL